MPSLSEPHARTAPDGRADPGGRGVPAPGPAQAAAPLRRRGTPRRRAGDRPGLRLRPDGAGPGRRGRGGAAHGRHHAAATSCSTRTSATAAPPRSPPASRRSTRTRTPWSCCSATSPASGPRAPGTAGAPLPRAGRPRTAPGARASPSAATTTASATPWRSPGGCCRSWPPCTGTRRSGSCWSSGRTTSSSSAVPGPVPLDVDTEEDYRAGPCRTGGGAVTTPARSRRGGGRPAAGPRRRITHGGAGQQRLPGRRRAGHGAVPGRPAAAAHPARGRGGRRARPRRRRPWPGCSTRPLYRLQCYEGIDAGEALYEWNHQRQLLGIRLAEVRDAEVTETDLFGPRVPAAPAAAAGDRASRPAPRRPAAG